jgi:hypothetical protein
VKYPYIGLFDDDFIAAIFNLVSGVANDLKQRGQQITVLPEIVEPFDFDHPEANTTERQLDSDIQALGDETPGSASYSSVAMAITIRNLGMSFHMGRRGGRKRLAELYRYTMAICEEIGEDKELIGRILAAMPGSAGSRRTAFNARRVPTSSTRMRRL